MAFTKITAKSRYIGTSADVKPTSAVPVDSRFVETDTQKQYVWNGSAWSALN